MVSQRLDFLLRRNKGISLFERFHKIFTAAGFRPDEHIDLERSDQIRGKLREIFPSIKPECEFIAGGMTADDSIFFKSVFPDSTRCYIFSDDVYFCGMYLVASEKAKEHCFDIARDDEGRTCFVLDEGFKFAITINYYDNEHREFKNT